MTCISIIIIDMLVYIDESALNVFVFLWFLSCLRLLVFHLAVCSPSVAHSIVYSIGCKVVTSPMVPKVKAHFPRY